MQRADLLHGGIVDVESHRFLLASDLLALDARVVVTTFQVALGHTEA